MWYCSKNIPVHHIIAGFFVFLDANDLIPCPNNAQTGHTHSTHPRNNATTHLSRITIFTLRPKTALFSSVSTPNCRFFRLFIFHLWSGCSFPWPNRFYLFSNYTRKKTFFLFPLAAYFSQQMIIVLRTVCLNYEMFNSMCSRVRSICIILCYALQKQTRKCHGFSGCCSTSSATIVCICLSIRAEYTVHFE